MGKIGPRGTAVALWHMNEASGTTMHDSVGGHDGTLVDVMLGVSGKSASAYHFNGTSSYAYVPVSAAKGLDPGSATIKIAIFVRTTHVPARPDFDLIRKGAYG